MPASSFDLSIASTFNAGRQHSVAASTKPIAPSPTRTVWNSSGHSAAEHSRMESSGSASHRRAIRLENQMNANPVRWVDVVNEFANGEAKMHGPSRCRWMQGCGRL